MTNTKALVASWTFWFGLLQILLAGVGFTSGLMDPQASMALLLTGLTSIGLRMKTYQPIGGIVRS